MGIFRKKEGQYYFLRRFIVVSIAFISLSLVSFWIGTRMIFNERRIELKADQEQKVLSEKNLMEHLFDDAVLDLLTISKNQLFVSFLAKQVNDVKYQESFEGLVKDLFEQKSNYYQLRCLDTNGMEVFRAERRNGKPYICSENELQNKNQRYYFQNTIKLDYGQFYVSPLDLNVERGEVELPYRPMLRICAPVFNAEGKKIGINVLNYDGRNFIQEMDLVSKGEEGLSYLINTDGYFLNALDSTIEWGFMFADKRNETLQRLFPEEYEKIEQTAAGQFETGNGLFTIADVQPFRRLADGKLESNNSKNYRWKVISFIPTKAYGITAFIPWQKLSLLYLFVLLAGMFLSYSYSNIALRKYQAQQALVESERELKIANQTKDRFFSIVAHDLKNASGTIANYLEFMQEMFDSFSEEDKKMHLKDVSFAAVQHNKLLYGILDWARLQMGKVEFKPIVVSIEELFKEQACLVELPLKNKGLQIDLEVDSGLQAYGDHEMLKTIFRNLINNAIKFSYRDSRILLSGKQKSEKIELRVIDSGIGMRESDAEKIFDLSSKIQQPGTENESGTGFGLKLVAELVEKNNGTIRVESELTKGSSFIISLPSGK